MTTVVTHDTGATGRPTTGVSVPPDRQLLPDTLPPGLVETGLDAAFVADLLSACLAHERCGTHLYHSVAARTSDDTLRTEYERLGDEARQQVEQLEELVAAAGGDPHYVSASARATEQAAASLLESTFLLAGSVDAMTAEIMMLEAAMLAQTKGRGNWELLTVLASAMAPGSVQTQMTDVASGIVARGDAHHHWAYDTRARVLLALAGAEPMDSPAADGDEAELDELTRDELYVRAQELDIAGRSQMTKDELREAVAAQDPPS